MKSAKDAFSEYLNDKGIRLSEQREHIADIFLKTEKHLTTADLYELVRKKHQNIGYSTVYRTLKLISGADLAEEVDFGDGVVRFEHKYGHKHHDHLICLECGSFIEAVKPEIEKLQEKLSREYDFTPTSHKLEIFGICKECKRKNQ